MATRMIRWALVLIAIVVIGGASYRLWCIRGLLRPIRIASGSMAPALIGPGLRVHCPDCGFRFPCQPDRDQLQDPVCPNCGHTASGQPARGQRVLIQRRRSPHRWDVVAISEPRQAAWSVNRQSDLFAAIHFPLEFLQ